MAILPGPLPLGDDGMIIPLRFRISHVTILTRISATKANAVLAAATLEVVIALGNLQTVQWFSVAIEGGS